MALDSPSRSRHASVTKPCAVFTRPADGAVFTGKRGREAVAIKVARALTLHSHPSPSPLTLTPHPSPLTSHLSPLTLTHHPSPHKVLTLTRDSAASVQKEIDLMKACKCEYIVAYRESFYRALDGRLTLWVVMEAS